MWLVWILITLIACLLWTCLWAITTNIMFSPSIHLMYISKTNTLCAKYVVITILLQHGPNYTWKIIFHFFYQTRFSCKFICSQNYLVLLWEHHLNVMLRSYYDSIMLYFCKKHMQIGVKWRSYRALTCCVILILWPSSIYITRYKVAVGVS